MSIGELVTTFSDYILFASCLFILAGSIWISIKMRFVQLRLFPTLIRTLWSSLFLRKQTGENHTILPHKALFTAMSTTLGIGTIVAPVIAIHLGGPGALVGFLLTSFFGSAATYVEVNLCIQHRKKLESGTIVGGPMGYMKHLLSPAAAKWYAIGCLSLMMVWSGAQANQLAAILDSPLLGDFRIPTVLSGLMIALFVLSTLAGGIQRVGALSAKLVPVMFTLYLGSCSYILLSNLDKLSGVLQDIFVSAFSPYSMATGAIVGGIVSSLRWGIFKGIQVTEAGIGTQTIPHSMAQTSDPVAQGTLAMLSTYTAGLVAFLSGIVSMLTGTWQDPTLPLGISMVAASFSLYFFSFGIVIIAISAMLFALGTIVGNSYNGSHCFGYLSKGKGAWYYFGASAVLIFLGAIAEVKLIWSLSDLVLASIALPHMTALIRHVNKGEERVEAPSAIPVPE